MVQLVERGVTVLEVVGSISARNTFSPEKQFTEIFRYRTISHRKYTGKWREIKLKYFGQLPLGTGSQRHIAEKFKET